MNEKKPFELPDYILKDDLAYAKMIRRQCKTKEDKERYDDIIHDLECELGDTNDFNPVLVFLWVLLIIAFCVTISQRGF